MGYHVVDPSTIEPTPDRPCVQRRTTASLGLEELAVNVYEAEPGEQLPLAYHYHDEQEELFCVLEGTLHVETPEEEYVVGSGELFAVAPGNPQRAYNPTDANAAVRVVAVGAPQVDGDVHAYETDD